MSTQDSNDQNGSDCTDNKHVSREELQLKLELSKLDIVKLRNRVAMLEQNIGLRSDVVETEDVSESLDRRRMEIVDKLQSVEGDDE